ncbi:hypothetical protein FRC05_005728 [Tulasnella sp. 425]|nr:hypothetical protein FRC05_005728 [Tulasnella sp. 425]
MSTETHQADARNEPPASGDVVAAFHTSFHFTQGNTLDWSITVDDGVYGSLLDKIEFTSLPSGLHGVERDVVYFNKEGHEAVACFWRKQNETKDDRRGYQMEAYGVLLERSAYPRPWRHVPTLKTINDKDALERYFNLHRKPTTPGTNSDSLPSSPIAFDWEAEILSSSSRTSSAASSSSHPLIHLPHLLRIVGPSFLTIYKHLLSRRRILFLTSAPVEAACLLTKACVDVAFPDVVMGNASENGGGSATEDEAGLERDDRRPAVLGAVGLMDIDRLKAESQTGLGWIACSTDTIFKDRPALYDLIVDLTTATNSLSPSSPSPTITRPTLHMSRPALSPTSSSGRSPQSGASYKLHLVRFTFSDIRLWTKIDKVLRECPVPHAHGSHDHGKGKEKAKDSRGWSDFLPWKLYSYEDVCIVCASIWLKGSDGGSGGIRLDGEDDAILIGGGKTVTAGEQPKATTSLLAASTRRRKIVRRASERSASSSSSGSTSGSSTSSTERRYTDFPPDVRTALMVLDIFHAQATFWLDGLQDLIILNDATSGVTKATQKQSTTGSNKKDLATVPLYPNHLIALQLSSLSEVDSRFVEWLAQARFKRTAAVKRGWKDMVAAIVGW